MISRTFSGVTTTLLALGHRLGDLLDRRLAAELLEQAARDADQPVDRLDHVDRDADRAGLVGDGARDRLADPPRGVRGELVALLVVELLDRPDEADVAFLDQVQERHAAADVLLGDRDDQAQVGRWSAARGASRPIRTSSPRRSRSLVLGRDLGVAAHPLEQLGVVAAPDPALRAPGRRPPRGSSRRWRAGRRCRASPGRRCGRRGRPSRAASRKRSGVGASL